MTVRSNHHTVTRVHRDGTREPILVPNRDSPLFLADLDLIAGALLACGPEWLTIGDLKAEMHGRLKPEPRYTLTIYVDYLIQKLVERRSLVMVKRPNSLGRKANYPARAYRHSSFANVRSVSPWPWTA